MRGLTSRVMSLLLAVGVGALPTACAPSTTGQPVRPDTHQRTGSVVGRLGYDISRIAAVAAEFPAGFTVQSGLSKTMGREDVEQTGTRALSEARLQPAHCLPMILPTYVRPTVGTEAAGVTASGASGGVQVSALRLAEPVSADTAPAGCDRVTISSPVVGEGVAESVPAPTIDGVTTTGVKLVSGGAGDAADYLYAAALDDRTVVVVRSRLTDALNPAPFMANLLTKAVAAVAGGDVR